MRLIFIRTKYNHNHFKTLISDNKTHFDTKYLRCLSYSSKFKCDGGLTI